MNTGGQDSVDRAAAAGPAVDQPFELRRPLFAKYFFALFIAVTVPMLVYGASQAWFGYIEQRALLSQRLQVEARAASSRIHDFLDGISEQMGWTVQLPWTKTNSGRRRLDALRLLRQVPAIVGGDPYRWQWNGTVEGLTPRSRRHWKQH